MLKLKLQYFGHLMWRAWEDPDAGKDWGQEEKGATEDEMVNLGKHQERVKDRETWCATVPGVEKSWSWLSNWTATTHPKNTFLEPSRQAFDQSWAP